MKEEWKDIVIQKINFALFVPPSEGAATHRRRAFHGLILNDADSVKDYFFSDGQVLHTEGESLFYLPKGSSYYVKSIRAGGCYAINFEADINDRPFSVKLKKVDLVKKRFQAACAEWKMDSSLRNATAMRALYEAVVELQRDANVSYLPNSKADLIRSAITEIEQRFTDPELTVAHLAELCNMSEVYFRKIFAARFNASPKEYIIQKRMEYAKQLLMLGEFEISRIAQLCGYSEPCHFSREFKKHFGVSPREYQ